MHQKPVVTGVVAVIAGAVLVWAGSAQAAGSITSYTDGLSGTSPTHITQGPDGNLWFTAGVGGYGDSAPVIGRARPSGAITTFSAGLGAGSSPYDITAGPDGNLWFTDSPVYGRGTAAIGRVTPAGTITEFTSAEDENGNPIELSEPRDIVAGPDGNLWFVSWAYVGGEPAIGKITTSGTITEYRLPQFSTPTSLIVGPDGNLWFTEASLLTDGTGSIGRITPSGTITTFSSGIQSGGKPYDIAVGPDGNLWFTVNSNESLGPAGIGRITTGGTITEFTAGLQAESHPEQVVAGGEGNLWFTDRGGSGHVEGEHPLAGQVGKVTTSGTITEYGHYLSPNSIIVGPDGNIWVSDFNHGFERVSPSGQITYFWLGQIEDAYAEDLVSGPGGSGLWFTGSGFTEEGGRTGVIGKIAPVGPTGTSPLPTIVVEEPDPEGSGIVASSPGGISCPGTCSSAFSPGTEVTLTATAAPGFLLTDPGLYMKEEEPCPRAFPPVSVPSATCHFKVNGDAQYFADLEYFGEEEETGGGGGSGEGGGSGASPAPIGQSQAAVSSSGPTNHQSSSGIAVAGGVATSKSGSVALSLHCPVGGICSGVVKLTAQLASGPVTKRHGKRHPSRRGRRTKHKRSVVLGKHAFSIAPGHSATVKVSVNAKGKAMLRHAGRHGLTVRLTGSGVTSRVLHLKPARSETHRKAHR